MFLWWWPDGESWILSARKADSRARKRLRDRSAPGRGEVCFGKVLQEQELAWAKGLLRPDRKAAVWVSDW